MVKGNRVSLLESANQAQMSINMSVGEELLLLTLFSRFAGTKELQRIMSSIALNPCCYDDMEDYAFSDGAYYGPIMESMMDSIKTEGYDGPCDHE